MSSYLCLAFALWACGEPNEVSGQAKAIDGDTIRISAQTVRLSGVDAPEMEQTCFSGSRAYACGWTSKHALASILSGAGTVECRSRGKDKYGRIIAFCKILHTGTDLGWWLVRRGLAVSTDTAYADVEHLARQEKIGLWSGEFTRPCLYRNPHLKDCR